MSLKWAFVHIYPAQMLQVRASGCFVFVLQTDVAKESWKFSLCDVESHLCRRMTICVGVSMVSAAPTELRQRTERSHDETEMSTVPIEKHSSPSPPRGVSWLLSVIFMIRLTKRFFKKSTVSLSSLYSIKPCFCLIKLQHSSLEGFQPM